MNKKKKREIIIVIVINILILLYYIFYFYALAYLLEGSILRVVMGVMPFIFALIMIKVTLDRIKEIKGGESDDLSKY